MISALVRWTRPTDLKLKVTWTAQSAKESTPQKHALAAPLASGTVGSSDRGGALGAAALLALTSALGAAALLARAISLTQSAKGRSAPGAPRAGSSHRIQPPRRSPGPPDAVSQRVTTTQVRDPGSGSTTAPAGAQDPPPGRDPATGSNRHAGVLGLPPP